MLLMVQTPSPSVEGFSLPTHPPGWLQGNKKAPEGSGREIFGLMDGPGTKEKSSNKSRGAGNEISGGQLDATCLEQGGGEQGSWNRLCHGLCKCWRGSGTSSPTLMVLQVCRSEPAGAMLLPSCITALFPACCLEGWHQAG